MELPPNYNELTSVVPTAEIKRKTNVVYESKAVSVQRKHEIAMRTLAGD